MSEMFINHGPRAATGTSEWISGRWFARISIPGSRDRKRVKLVHPVEHRPLNQKEADADLAKQLARDLSLVARTDSFEIQSVEKQTGTSVEEFGEQWTSGTLFEKYGHVRGLTNKVTARDDRSRLRAHIYPHIGHLNVKDVTEEDIEKCIAKAAIAATKKRSGEPWRAATRFHVYQVTKRLFDLAIKPGRLRTDNPVSLDMKPRKDADKLFSFLYPKELLTLLECTEVPIQRRVYYAIAVYTGLRIGSLQKLTWGSIDFVTKTMVSPDSKTGIAQIFALKDNELVHYESLLTLLERWYEYRSRPAKIAPIVDNVGCRTRREATALRDDLRLAGVNRELLFTKTTTIEPIRFHDLRATFLSWARRAGKGEGWIADRTGHSTQQQMNRYDRGARQLSDLEIKPFPDLSNAIPEFRDPETNVVRLFNSMPAAE